MTEYGHALLDAALALSNRVRGDIANPPGLRVLRRRPWREVVRRLWVPAALGRPARRVWRSSDCVLGMDRAGRGG